MQDCIYYAINADNSSIVLSSGREDPAPTRQITTLADTLRLCTVVQCVSQRVSFLTKAIICLEMSVHLVGFDDSDKGIISWVKGSPQEGGLRGPRNDDINRL